MAPFHRGRIRSATKGVRDRIGDVQGRAHDARHRAEGVIDRGRAIEDRALDFAEGVEMGAGHIAGVDAGFHEPVGSGLFMEEIERGVDQVAGFGDAPTEPIGFAARAEPPVDSAPTEELFGVGDPPEERDPRDIFGGF